LATQIIQLATKEGITYAAAVKKQKVINPTVKAPLSVVVFKPTIRFIETQTNVPTPKTRTIETQIDDQLTQETHTESTFRSKKRKLSEQTESSNRS